MKEYEKFIGSIYDCAANPELWPNTLNAINDHFKAAFVQVGVTDIPRVTRAEVPNSVYKTSPWDPHWLKELGHQFPNIPGGDRVFHQEIDDPWVQSQVCSETEYRRSKFYKEWVEPQKLLDCITVPLMRRKDTIGFVTVAGFEERGKFDDIEIAFAAALSPHLRRAVAISDLVDRNRLELALYRRVVDQMSVPVIIVGTGNHIVGANAAAEAMLVDGQLIKSVSGTLSATRTDNSGLLDALDRAAAGDIAIGLKGIGVPLTSATGERAAAYVLPIAGKDIRSEMGKGFATVFIARRGEHLPTAIEVLRSMFDLSQMEARVAALIARGDAPADIATALGLGVSTIRTHLKNAFVKTETQSQASLSALINTLMPPMMG